jgi:hypothetical protein
MQEGNNKPSFGAYIFRVLLIILAVFLLGFIIWGVIELVGNAGGWSSVVGVVVSIVVIGLAFFAIRMLLSFLSSNSISLSWGRVLGFIAGLILIGFLVWGVYRLADTSDSSEVVKVSDEENSTITLDAPEQTPEPQSDSGNTSPESAPDAQSGSEPEASQDAPTTPAPTEESTPNTGPAQDLPETGIETSLLSILSLGLLAYTTKSLLISRKQLKQL